MKPDIRRATCIHFDGRTKVRRAACAVVDKRAAAVYIDAEIARLNESVSARLAQISRAPLFREHISH